MTGYDITGSTYDTFKTTLNLFPEFHLKDITVFNMNKVYNRERYHIRTGYELSNEL